MLTTNPSAQSIPALLRESAMPAHKRIYEAEEDDPLQSIRNNYLNDQDDDDSDESPSHSDEDKDEFVVVKLSEVRKEVQCPICLGIIRKTRTVMECLHRFCRECIDKSMRLGNNECPACRTHCASRRSLRDDPNYDAIIAALYPDIDRYEEEELTFDEDEKARNSQIQASIAQTIKRQTEALGKKRTTAKAAAAFFKRSEGNRRANTRGRRKRHAAELHGSDDNEFTNGHDGGKDSSSSDEYTEVKPKRCKRQGISRFSQPTAETSAANGSDGENDTGALKDSLGTSGGFVRTSDRLSWGKGGIRSHTRYGSGAAGGNAKSMRNTRLSKLVDYFKNLEDNDYEMDIRLMLVSFDEHQVPTLEQPYLCCRRTLSIRHLCQYIALQTTLQADEVEILVVKEQHPLLSADPPESTPASIASILNMSKDALQILEGQETLAGLGGSNLTQGHLLLIYRKKLLGLEHRLISEE